MPISPTAEGFRAAFRRPSFTFAEIAWRWCVGATATVLFFFGLFEYLDTLPVTDRELLLLRSRQPFLIGQALAHILRGSLNRAVMSLMLAALLVSVLWMIAASVGRIATVRAVLEFFRTRFSASGASSAPGENPEPEVAKGSFVVLFRLNFLRAAVALAVLLGFFAATILAGFASPDANPRPGLAFLVFFPLAVVIALVGWGLNWFLSLAGILAVRDCENVVGALSAAASFFRERTGAVVAVSTWTGLAHLVLLSAASTVVAVPLGMAGLLPGRLVALAVVLVALAYFAVADWLYMARLAGYVCILEMPEVLPTVPSPSSQPLPPVQTTIDRDEPILSDLPGLAAGT